MIELSADEARRAALWAQGLLGSRAVPRSTIGRVSAVRDMLEHLGAVQLDTISVLARSHELVAYARLGAIGRDAIETAYWEGTSAFEYWSHAACILPMDEWPWFSFRRRHYLRKGKRWHGVPTKVIDGILRRLEAEGPLTTRELGGARKSADWWDWSESKIATEWLLDIGRVVVSRRVGWRRVYDLPERVVPSESLYDASDDDCLRRLVALGGHSVGVGTIGDIADIHRLGITQAVGCIHETDLVEVHVEGWEQRAWASPQALQWLASGARSRSRTTLLSPFDSLVWNRDRMERVFGMQHRIEAYTPASQRVHGYFAMPVLHGGRLVGRVDPARVKGSLVARRVTLETSRSGTPVAGAVQGVAGALREAAGWVGACAVQVEQVIPASAEKAVKSAAQA